MTDEICGIYQHYKGKKYLVLGAARHTETGEDVVVYVPLYEHEEGGRPLQCRPLSMWSDEVPMHGRSGVYVNRFSYVGRKLKSIQ